MVQTSFTVERLLQLAHTSEDVLSRLPRDVLSAGFQGLETDSRHVVPGSVFVAIKGCRVDGHRFLMDAAAAGAIAAFVEEPIPAVPLPQIVVENSAELYGRLSMMLAVGRNNPVQTAGVTGTNGKTTTTWMLRSILEASGRQTGLIGTICHHDGVQPLPSEMTTPDAATLADAFRAMANQQTTHCAMEVSSHALAQNRAAGVQLSVAAITNVTQDHFDYHGNLQNYRAAKASITKLLLPAAPLLLNVDDAGCRAIMEQLPGSIPVVTCGLENPDAEITATLIRQTHRSTTVRLRLAQGDCEVRLKLVGRHNVSNCLMAAALAEQLGVQLHAIVEGLQNLAAVPGRLQRIDRGQPFQVFVDYAHTPDAVRHCLQTVRRFTPGQVICVLGAGGDRDRSKRPAMGQAASIADRCIITSDNPRSESPEAIIQDVLQGIGPTSHAQSFVDRSSAIEFAIETAAPGDTVVIAGRGHEVYQEQNGQRVLLDDCQVAEQALKLITSGIQVNPVYARSA